MAAHNGHDEQHQRLSVHTKSSMAAGSSVGATTTNSATMDGRTVHVATHSSVKSSDAHCE